jgi:4-amino-4-deoxy-L-arabinose transferase-like glycosyltransferase
MRLWLYALVALTVLRLILAARLPLAPDEAYYYLWSRHLQTGYFDAPPMVAYFIRAGVWCVGNTPLGIRLFAPLLAGLGSLLLWDAGERMFPHRHAGVIAAALMNATLMVGAGAIVMTPDTPLLFFWTACVAACARLLSSGNPRWWLAVGLAVGLALLSKYTAVLFVVAALIWMLTSSEGRAMLRTPWPWIAAVLAGVVFAPDVAWNAAHGWASFIKQGSRVEGFHAARSAQFLGELVFGQIGLATPIVFALAVLGVWRLRDMPGAAGHLLVWLTLVPGVVFLEHVISGRVQANWVAILYPSACLAAASLPMAVLRRWLKPALGLGFGLTALVYAQALAGVFPIPARADPTALQFAGWRELVAASTAGKPAFVTSDEYATAAMLAYYAPTSVPVAGFSPRWRNFALPSAKLQGMTGILVTPRPATACAEPVGTVTRKRGNEVIGTFRLCRIVAGAPGVLLPRP